MKGAVVFQSKWGNCRQVAEAIGKGLEETGHEVSVEPVKSVKELEPELGFILVGGPTRMARAYGPIKRFATSGVTGALEGKPFATFSTGATVDGEKQNAQASERLHEILAGKGLTAIAGPFKARVEDMHGPLAEGELDRALQFGRELGAKLSG